MENSNLGDFGHRMADNRFVTLCYHEAGKDHLQIHTGVHHLCGFGSYRGNDYSNL